MPEKPKQEKKLEITLQPSIDISATRVYSNHVEVSFSPNDFTIRFCDAPPIYDLDEVKANKGVHKVPVVAEIAISFNLMPSLIKVLQAQYKRHQETIKVNDGKKTPK